MISTYLLFVLLVHMCGVTQLLVVRFSSAQTARMSDVLVDDGKWNKLEQELGSVLKDAEKVDAFMSKHVNTKWDV